MGYRFLEHIADVKLRADGSTVEEMFISAVGALNETIRGDIKILEQEERVFEVDGNDMETLLYNFLEEFLFLLEAEEFLVARVKSLEVDDLKIKCVVVGDDAGNYIFTNDVKAVTFNEMYVHEVVRGCERGCERDGKYSDDCRHRWECQVVLDV